MLGRSGAQCAPTLPMGLAARPWGGAEGGCCSFEDPDEKVSFLPSAQTFL